MMTKDNGQAVLVWAPLRAPEEFQKLVNPDDLDWICWVPNGVSSYVVDFLGMHACTVTEHTLEDGSRVMGVYHA